MGRKRGRNSCSLFSCAISFTVDFIDFDCVVLSILSIYVKLMSAKENRKSAESDYKLGITTNFRGKKHIFLRSSYRVCLEWRAASKQKKVYFSVRDDALRSLRRVLVLCCCCHSLLTVRATESESVIVIERHLRLKSVDFQYFRYSLDPIGRRTIVNSFSLSSCVSVIRKLFEPRKLSSTKVDVSEWNSWEHWSRYSFAWKYFLTFYK